MKIVHKARANFSHAPLGVKPRLFLGVYRDRSNVERISLHVCTEILRELRKIATNKKK